MVRTCTKEGDKRETMKKTIWRLFVNFEKEEDWLNEMSAKGLAFTDYFFGRYTFADSDPGEYVYRIELLENRKGHPESRKYLSFMAESGAECISTWYRWVFFRKKAASGSFDIYSDRDSRISHYKRVSLMFLGAGIAEICIGTGQIVLVIGSFLSAEPLTWYLGNLILAGLLWGIGIIFLRTWNSLRKKNKALKQEKNVWE